MSENVTTTTPVEKKLLAGGGKNSKHIAQVVAFLDPSSYPGTVSADSLCGRSIELSSTPPTLTDKTCKTCAKLAAPNMPSPVEPDQDVSDVGTIGYSDSSECQESTGGIVSDEQSTATIEPETTEAPSESAEPATTATEAPSEAAAPPVEAAPAPAKARRTRAKADKSPAKEVYPVEELAVAEIILDSDIQPRENISSATIGEYAEALQAGAEFPAIVVFRNQDSGEILAADGWHRVSATRQANRTTIKAEVRPGTKRDAILYSVSTNATHGLRRTDADKRRAAMRLLNDPEWGQWSASVIAEKIGVSQPFVSAIRRAMMGEGEAASVRTSDGRQMNTGRMGRPTRQRPAAGTESSDSTATPPPAPASNGTAPAAVDDADALLAGAPQVGSTGDAEPQVAAAPEAEADPFQQFVDSFIHVVMNVDRFNANDVMRALSDQQRKDMGDKWPDVVEAIDSYSTALEEFLG